MGGKAAAKPSLQGGGAEHLKGWLAETRKEEAAVTKAAAEEGTVSVIVGPGGEELEEKRKTATEAMKYWEKVVALVRADFGEGRLSEEAMCQAVVLIPKGKGEYHRIGLVEVVWKVVAEILNLQLTSSITYHDFIHGLRAGRGTGTATLKAKLLHQLADLREEVLYVLFMYLHKVYDALDRDR